MRQAELWVDIFFHILLRSESTNAFVKFKEVEEKEGEEEETGEVAVVVVELDSIVTKSVHTLSHNATSSRRDVRLLLLPPVVILPFEILLLISNATLAPNISSPIAAPKQKGGSASTKMLIEQECGYIEGAVVVKRGVLFDIVKVSVASLNLQEEVRYLLVLEEEDRRRREGWKCEVAAISMAERRCAVDSKYSISVSWSSPDMVIKMSTQLAICLIASYIQS